MKNSYATLLILSAGGAAAQWWGAGVPYVLEDAYEGTSFFDGWNFFNDTDPTHGFVTYVNQSTAKADGLVSASQSSAYIGVDYKSVLNATSGPGRRSVRLSSKKNYTEALIIGDFSHMPYGCGAWPAFWSFGPDWPNSGEIDMIEGVSLAKQNLMSLHTSANCTTAGANETGTLLTANCDQAAPNQYGSGCGVQNNATNSFGSNFNAMDGGVYATEWTANYIRGWFFPRSAIPWDIQRGYPMPETWGPPSANFQGSCDIPAHFKEHNILFDTTFCGDWAGNVWAGDPVCSKLAPTCVAYVASTPAAFEDAYWQVNYVKVYKQRKAQPFSWPPHPYQSRTPLISIPGAMTMTKIGGPGETGAPQWPPGHSGGW